MKKLLRQTIGPETRVSALHAKLCELAYAKGPDAKLPTTREICRDYGASLNTLNAALDELEARHIITRKHGSGIYVSPRIHRKTIAVVFNSVLLGANASPFWGMLLSQFAEHAATRGREADQDFVFFMTSPTAEPQGQLPEHLTRAIRAGAVNGVVGVSLSVESARWIQDQGVPYIAYAGWSKWTVVTAGEGFIQTGLQILRDQGCRRVEYWGLPRHRDTEAEWYEQLRADVEAAYDCVGLDRPQTSVGPALELLAEAGLHLGTEAHACRAYNAAKTLFRNPARPKPDGLFVGDDSMASGVLLGLQELGIRVGKDIKIVSQANRTSLILFGSQQHHITLLEFDPTEIAGTLLDMLDKAMANPDLPEAEISVPWRVRLPELRD